MHPYSNIRTTIASKYFGISLKASSTSAYVNVHVIDRAITLVFFTVTIQLCQGHSTYQAKMPNGDKVPNPCSLTTGSTWPGVGHIAEAGMGARNVFGIAFKAANLVSIL